MNFVLMEEVIRHIFANLAIVPSPRIDTNKTISIRDKNFLLSQKLVFTDDVDKEVQNSIWGCNINTSQSTEGLTLLLGDCTQYSDIPEFCLIVSLKDAPVYGLYLVYNDLKEGCLSDPLIGVSTNNKDWMPCDTYLQATFLAGMEQIRDLNFGKNKLINYQHHFELLQSFIKFHNIFYRSL